MSGNQGQVSLAMTKKHHEQLNKHLFPGDGCEAVAIALCGRARNMNASTLLVQEVHAVPYDACTVRQPDKVTWCTESILPLLEKAMNSGLGVVKIHSHPGGYRNFSHLDDQSDLDLFASIYGWLDTDEPQASLIMLPDGELIGRSTWPEKLGKDLHTVRVVGDDIKYWFSEHIKPEIPKHAIRIVQAFGDGTYSIMRRLRVGVVGCSGTGSIIIEQLARNHVGNLVVVDPEPVEHGNLNRILNSTWQDAEEAKPKVDVLVCAIEKMKLGTHVVPLECDLMTRQAIKALSQCDVIFGCMDSVDGRHILNKLASYYLIPYIDMGVRIDADGKGGIESINGAVHYIQPSGSSLLSRGVYTSAGLDAAMMHRQSPELYKEREKQGYIKGVRVDQPAVISVNMQIASMAFNEFLARIHPYRVEHNSKYAQRRVVMSDPEASVDLLDGESCKIFSRFVAMGDQEPLLNLQDLANDKEHLN